MVRDGELVWADGYGDLEGVRDVTDVQYRIGSITKTFTAVLVLQLVRDGRLDLAQPASDVLGDVGYADRSLRSLLSHSSGMQAEPNGSWWERSDGVAWDALVAANGGSDGVLPAGQQYHYSNLGFALLGQVAAAAARHQLVRRCSGTHPRAPRAAPHLVRPRRARSAGLERRPVRRHPHR